jgi:hypothetical protein
MFLGYDSVACGHIKCRTAARCIRSSWRSSVSINAHAGRLGQNDLVFPPEGATPYTRDLKNFDIHMLDTGHFAPETHGKEVARHIESFFLKRQSKAA